MDFLVGKVSCGGYPLQYANVIPYYISGGTTYYIDKYSIITDKNGNYGIPVRMISPWSTVSRKGVKVSRDGCITTGITTTTTPPPSEPPSTPPTGSTKPVGPPPTGTTSGTTTGTTSGTTTGTTSGTTTSPQGAPTSPQGAPSPPDTAVTSAYTINVVLTSTKRVATYESLYALGCTTLGNSASTKCLTYEKIAGGGGLI